MMVDNHVGQNQNTKSGEKEQTITNFANDIHVASLAIIIIIIEGYFIYPYTNAPISIMPHLPHPGNMWGQGGDLTNFGSRFPALRAKL